jgi:uncharacterized iron-regulated protein
MCPVVSEVEKLSCVMTHKGKVLDLEDFFNVLMDYNVIFIGEEHESLIVHKTELTILTELTERDSSLVLALKMFERDVQDILDDYLKGRVSEDEFLAKARPWPNYHEDYRPLIELAKRKGLPVIAANIPRRVVAVVAMANKITPEVLGSDNAYVPNTFYLDSKEYYKRFLVTMGTMPDKTPMKSMKPEALFKAQVLKDAVMAESLNGFRDRRILFCCGHFHSDYHLGIPYQLKKNHPDLKIAVITFASYVGDLPMKSRSRIGDFIWLEE